MKAKETESSCVGGTPAATDGGESCSSFDDGMATTDIENAQVDLGSEDALPNNDLPLTSAAAGTSKNDAVVTPTPSHTAASDKLKLVTDYGVDEERMTGIETIDDEESPPMRPSHLEDENSLNKNKKKGVVEQIPASEPYPGVFNYDDAQAKNKELVETLAISPPLPEGSDVLVHDDSMKGITSPPLEDTREIQSVLRGPSILSSTKTEEVDASNSEHIRPPNVLISSQSTTMVGSNVITADVNTMSTCFNAGDEIVIPEATAVNDEDIPSATVVEPEKCSMTIAGRKIKLHYLVLGMVLILGVIIGVAVPLTKNNGKHPSPALALSSAPSSSLSPSMEPSSEPSTRPTATIQAELVPIIFYSVDGTISNSSADRWSAHQIMALDWLVDDQKKWREEGLVPLSDPEIVERYVLALMYYETGGDEWTKPFHFMDNSLHVCKWRDYEQRKFQKGVIRCSGDGLIRNLTLTQNKLRGSLPTEIGLLKELDALHLAKNGIQGSIPDSMGSLSRMSHLELYRNSFHETIDPLASLTNLQHIDLNFNRFSGSINSLAGLGSLNFIDVSNNEMAGALMNASNLTGLQTFKASDNRFSGTVPKSFSNMSMLETFHIQNNRLVDDVYFMCKILPEVDHRMDCFGNPPEIICNCCLQCPVVNDTECDPETEKPITMIVFAGTENTDFEWELKDDETDIIIVADKTADDYNDPGEQIGIKLCLPFPGWYTLSATTDIPTPQPVPWTPVPTNPPTVSQSRSELQSPTFQPVMKTFDPTFAPTVNMLEHRGGVSYEVDGNKGSVVPNTWRDMAIFYVSAPRTAEPTVAPTRSSMPTSSSIPTSTPSLSLIPTSSSRPTAPTPFPTESGVEADQESDSGYGGSRPPIGGFGEAESFSPSPANTASQTLGKRCGDFFQLTLTTDSFGLDTSWELIDTNTGTVVESEGSDGSFPSNETLSFEHCLDASGCYDFVIKDAWDDGICCLQGNGSYHVYVNDNLMGSGGKFGTSDTVSLGGNCPGSTQGWPSAPTSSPESQVTSPGSFICPPVDKVGCTAVDPANPRDECQVVGEPCRSGDGGEFCCEDSCSRNYCTSKNFLDPQLFS